MQTETKLNINKNEIVEYQHQHKAPSMPLEINKTYVPTVFLQSDISKLILHVNHNIRHTYIHLINGFVAQKSSKTIKRGESTMNKNSHTTFWLKRYGIVNAVEHCNYIGLGSRC